MTKRIKEVIDGYRNSRFFIQRKFIIWWTSPNPTHFSLENVEKDINHVHDRVVKYYY
jgi:hypothetical protein